MGSGAFAKGCSVSVRPEQELGSHCQQILWLLFFFITFSLFVLRVSDMSAASCLLTEDQFLCSICLDVFTDPVSIPCGHNFCKTCITEHWNINVLCQCPNCKEVFYTRPELRVNTFISEMAAQFRQSAQQKASSSSSEQQVSKPGEVPCDVCTGTKLKALKSCLVCLASLL
ncbi:hypothetical protein L3Q82_023555 [Scortum barcoo]|uniref:Uncharacterized protein n=1 Tax=Scortum barcoo TaxID=214431 RepID=A0ACB8WU56_9TELE|nr:hypothetical protein L3Q82_023555 [Scortum barcoo]